MAENPPAGSTASTRNIWILPVLLSSGISIATVVCGRWAVDQHVKYLRSKWLEEEEQKQKDNDKDLVDAAEGQRSSFSVIGHFKSLKLGAQSTILEANRRRTTSYYEKARQAHEQSLVLGTSSYSKLLEKRKEEMNRLMFYNREGKRSLRTVIVMLDPLTQKVLSEARQKILQPLNYSWDIYDKGVWIPEISMIPNEDMHVTVACPWWWHTIREGNSDLNNDLSIRLKQALVIDFHHPFFIELERFVLLGGKTLVALWRTVGDRVVKGIESNNIVVVCDRHATEIDPMVRLRREIVDCFTNDQHEHNFRPLTHQHRQQTGATDATTEEKPLPPPLPKPQKLNRTHTIESKTPGLGSGDGFIHTTLCRLPLECFSTHDVELEPIHRLCREATATYSGHRMLVHKFRFVETTGAGGDSNPCKNPLFDITIEAPLRVVPRKVNTEVGGDKAVAAPMMSNRTNSSDSSNIERNALTTGRALDLSIQGRAVTTGRAVDLDLQGRRKGLSSRGIEGLFDPPSSNGN